MKGEIELYNISFLILKVELHFNICNDILLWMLCVAHVSPYDIRNEKIGRVYV